MPKINHTYFKLKMLEDFLTETAKHRQSLLRNAVETGGLDKIKLMRRFRMLKQLSEYEAQIIDKINNLKVDNVNDYLDQGPKFCGEIPSVTNRDA